MRTLLAQPVPISGGELVMVLGAVSPLHRMQALVLIVVGLVVVGTTTGSSNRNFGFNAW